MLNQIVIGQAGEVGQITVYPHAFILSLTGRRVRFNKRIEVTDPRGWAETSIDIGARTGDLPTLWKLCNAEVVRIEMDADSFRLLLKDGITIRSPNIMEDAQADPEQVDFWTPVSGHYDDPPAPDAVKHYPAVLAQ